MLHTYLYATRNMLRRMIGTRINGEEIVHISTPASATEKQKNYLGLMFVGMEQEPAHQGNIQGFSLDVGIIIMVYSNFVDYADSLHFLSLAMKGFQENLALHPYAFPDLALLNPIYVSPYFLPIEQQLQAWNPFSGNSSPSMFYKLRSLRIQTSLAIEPPMTAVDAAQRNTQA